MIFIGVLAMVVGLLFVRGVTIDCFWDWFLIDPGAPFYGKLPDISLAESLGIALIVSVFTYGGTVGQDADDAANEGKSAGVILGTAFSRALVLYGLWWLLALVLRGWI